MKNAPFLLSSALALLAVVLSFVSFGASQTNNSLQSDFLKKQTEFQDLNNKVTLQNQEYQRQAEIINTGANLGQKVISPILVEMGYVAAKKNNTKFRDMLKESDFEKAIPDKDALEKMDKLIQENKAKQGGAATPVAPAPKTSAPVAPQP
jgi:ASC-1-like (ASCH) protein